MANKKPIYKMKVKAEVFDGDECYGICDFTNKEIVLSEITPATDRLDTVIHEALHMAKPRMKHKGIEELADVLARCLKMAKKRGYLNGKIW